MTEKLSQVEKDKEETTKELKEMAAVNYRENRIIPAYNNLCQAMTLSPHDKSIALSLLKVLVQINKTEPLSDSQYEVAVNAADLLGKAALPANQQQKRDEYLSALSLNENTVPATPE